MPTHLTPAHDEQAEQSTLGAMLLNRAALGDVTELLTADDFYYPNHGHIFEAITKLFAANDPVDVVTVAAQLNQAGHLDAIGGHAALMGITQNTPGAAGAGHYATIVRNAALLRRMGTVGTEIVEAAHSNPADVSEVLDAAETNLFAVGDRLLSSNPVPVRAVALTVLDNIEAAYGRNQDGLPPLAVGSPTGWSDLDRILGGGIRDGHLVIVGARPAMGKTAAVGNLAFHVAHSTGRPVLFHTMEMTNEEITERFISALAKVDAVKFRNGQLTELEWSRISNAASAVAETNIHIEDSSYTTVNDIRAKARRLKATEGDLAMIIVDYIQLMTGHRGAASREQEVAEISRQLKILSGEMGCPVVVAAQLNRNLESRTDKRPVLSDLRESGSLEMNANVVIFLYRDEVYDDQSSDRGVAEVIVAKNRGGATGKTRLAFMPQYVRFESMTRRLPPAGVVPPDYTEPDRDEVF